MQGLNMKVRIFPETVLFVLALLGVLSLLDEAWRGPAAPALVRFLLESLVARQSAFLDQVVAKLAEPKAILVIIETRTREHGQPDVGKTRGVAVAVFEGESHQAANDKRIEPYNGCGPRSETDFAADTKNYAEIIPAMSVRRRHFLTACAAGAAAPLVRAAAPQLNILYIHSHDTGRYIQPYGHAVPTPNLQRLAERGVLFRKAFNAAPTCSPSRASLLTGMCPHSNGMLGLAHRGFSMADYRQHILHTLRPAGYHTALIGLQHIASDPKMIGYDQVQSFQGNRTEDVAPAAAAFLSHAPATPFFLDVGFFETHRVFRTPGPHEDARFSQPPAPIPDTPESRADIAAFKASARVMDEGVGVVLRALESSSLANNTLVISTTDHGIPFPAMKCNCTDHGMGVSLILRGPGVFSGGKVIDAMVSQLDLFPTICDLLEIEIPARLQGVSLLPLLRGERQEIHEEIFAEVNYHAAYEPQRAVRTHRWKYIRRFDGRIHPNLPNCDDGPSKTVWLNHGWRDRLVEQERLYDLMFDPNEDRNVAADPSCRAALDEMRGRLNRWMYATSDPILRGPIAAPPGAVANNPDGTSPNETPQPVR
jgi:N-sulfoglucosamine sulfohydrolase